MTSSKWHDQVPEFQPVRTPCRWLRSHVWFWSSGCKTISPLFKRGSNSASNRKSGGRWRHQHGMIRCPNFRRFERRIERSDRMFCSGAVDVKLFCHWLNWGPNSMSNRKLRGRWRHQNGMLRCPNFSRFERRIDR